MSIFNKSKESSVEAQLAVISTKLDMLLSSRDDQERRLRKLEQFKWVLLGVAAASGVGTSAIAQLLS